MVRRKKHNNGILEFRDDACRKLFQGTLYKYTDDRYLEFYMGYIIHVSHSMGFYPTMQEVKNSSISLMKKITSHIKEPENILINIGSTWGGIILSMWMGEMDIDDPEEKGLSILATLLRELDYLKEKESKI